MNADLIERYRDVERALASCVLAHGKAEVVEAVTPDQIADPTARAIVAAAAALLASGCRPDPVTVAQVLGQRQRDWPGRITEVHQHPGAVWANWAAYAGLVREGDYRRRAVAAAERIIQAAESGDLDTLANVLAVAAEVTR